MTGGSPTSGPDPPVTTRATSSRLNASKQHERSKNDASGSRAPESSVHDSAEGRRYLESIGYFQSNTPASPHYLALAIFKLVEQTGRVPKACAEGMRSVAFLLQDLNDAITPIVNELKETRAAIREVTELVRDANARTPDVLRVDTDKLFNRFKSAGAELVEEAVAAAAPQIAAGPLSEPHSQPAALTFADIARIQQPPARHAEVIARSKGREKQILVELDGGEEESNNMQLRKNPLEL
ncbi:hypothetical protein BD410DRAFT_833106 [Rickenella mellea]|uniref:Uncharacterized protein n=1 Tax=Rickenella mellea TaxID=50990 RepID=A0A4Y7PH23_9AGAM|nr:hypothetical protein BD410DRAFT_833106 [Rickenella mellea]